MIYENLNIDGTILSWLAYDSETSELEACESDGRIWCYPDTTYNQYCELAFSSSQDDTYCRNMRKRKRSIVTRRKPEPKLLI